MRHIILSFLLLTGCSGIGDFERGLLFRAIRGSITDVNNYDVLIARYHRFGVYNDYINHIHANKINFRFLYSILRRYPGLSNGDIKAMLSHGIYSELKPLDVDEVLDSIRILFFD